MAIKKYQLTNLATGRTSEHVALAGTAGPDVLVGQVDIVRSYGAGVGLHLGKELRLGFNVDHIARDSELRDLRYSTLRIGTSITYGF